jgi:prepilin-type N-terminal cleavage/methylation domain-containing protein
MTREAGFSLVEVLAALFVLSLTLVVVGGIISNVSGLWSRTQTNLAEVDAMTVLAEQVTHGFAPSNSVEAPSPVLRFEDGTEIRFNQEPSFMDADCAFDVIGRRCR